MMSGKKQTLEASEMELAQALKNFRESVHAWSEAEFSRPRKLAPAALHQTWRRVAVWALGCVLALVGLSAGLYERRQLKEQAKNGPAQTVHQAMITASSTASDMRTIADSSAKQIAQAEASGPDESLLAAVDNDVSRQVPSAMEPLAQLMENNSSQ